MKQKKSAFREKAEKTLSSRRNKQWEDSRPNDVLIHELQVHQIELEMQNDELRRTQARLEDFYQSTSIGYFILDEKWTILEANPTGSRMLGAIQMQIIKKPFHDFIKPEFQDTFYLHSRKVLRSVHPDTCELILKNNMYVSIESIAILDEQGKKTGKIRSLFTGITERKIVETTFIKELESQVDERTKELQALNKSLEKEIAERKRMEEEIRRRSNELEWANEELESFTYSVSHDLRSPLRAIDGFASMLLNDMGDKLDPESMRKFKVIRNNTERMTQLIDDLLKLSRTGRATLSRMRIEMHSLVKDVWEELRAGNRDRSMELKISDLPLVSGDKVLIRQVLSNLVGNAVKFTSKRDHAVIEVSGSVSDGFITYCVKDNGAGFDMRYYDKLFGVFRRLHSQKEFEGTGVGLAIVKKIIQKHGGTIWAEGKPGEGATFCFTLPVEK